MKFWVKHSLPGRVRIGYDKSQVFARQAALAARLLAGDVVGGEQAGYVERTRSAEDDRVVLITLTEEGRAMQERAKDVPLCVAGCIRLPPEKARTLYTLLYELLEQQDGGAHERHERKL